MDSRENTIEHIQIVREMLELFCKHLDLRGQEHDRSKLFDPEKAIFDKMIPKLKSCDYGTPEYMEMLDELKPALDHHYKHNSHHAEHAGRKAQCDMCGNLQERATTKCENCGVTYTWSIHTDLSGMNLIDLVEMMCDWKAATLRHDSGDISKSMEVNTKRFNIPDDLVKILENTIDYFGWR